MTANPACGPLDLETALQLTAARNDEVAIRRAEVEAALADVAVARALRIVPEAHVVALVGPTPAARGNVVASPDSNRQPLRDLGPFGRVEGTVIQPLFTWGRLQAAADASEAGAKAQALLMQDDLARVQERIVRLYWADALARRLLAIAADIEQALSEADRRVARSLERADGETTQTDRYRLTLFGELSSSARWRPVAAVTLPGSASPPLSRCRSGGCRSGSRHWRGRERASPAPRRRNGGPRRAGSTSSPSPRPSRPRRRKSEWRRPRPFPRYSSAAS